MNQTHFFIAIVILIVGAAFLFSWMRRDKADANLAPAVVPVTSATEEQPAI